MNLRQLEAFRAVMIAGSTVGAAEMMRVSQPAISQMIRQLERHSAIQLFHRRNGRIFPTPEADILFAETERVYAGVRAIDRLADGLRQNRYGRLRIAGFPAISRRLLPQIIAEYCKTRPEIDISLDSTQSRNLADLVARQEIEIAVSVLPSDRDEVRAMPVSSVHALCVMPRNHRLVRSKIVDAKDLEGESFISLGRTDQTRLAIDKIFEAAGIKRRLRMETTQSDMACGLVAEGCGVSIVDRLTMSGYCDDRIVARPFTPAISFKIWLLRFRSTKQARLTEDFSAFLETRIQELLAAI